MFDAPKSEKNLFDHSLFTSSRRRDTDSRIDMVPMIDTLLQLFVVFMLNASFLTPLIQVQLPQAATADPEEQQDVMVTLDEQGQCFLNRQLVPLDRLADELRPVLARSPSKAVTLRGDE